MGGAIPESNVGVSLTVPISLVLEQWRGDEREFVRTDWTTIVGSVELWSLLLCCDRWPVCREWLALGPPRHFAMIVISTTITTDTIMSGTTTCTADKKEGLRINVYGRRRCIIAEEEYSTGQQNLTQYNATQRNTTQHSTTQHNTTQQNKTQHNTT